MVKKHGQSGSLELKQFISDLNKVFSIPQSKKVSPLALAEFPFDHELLSQSPLYLMSRKAYLSFGGSYSAKVCSTMRSLSAQDLFKDQIEYSPTRSELHWFKDHYQEVADPAFVMKALSSFSDISLFHEQNHRILWRLLPPAPEEKNDFCRYLNFAESLVVTLDLALGDELGQDLSSALERLKIIYRPGGEDVWHLRKPQLYRQYLKAIMYATYLVLELINPEDVLKATDYVLPGQKKINKAAVRRALELSELFTFNTNQQWQERYWEKAQKSLAAFHKKSEEDVLYLPEDPLDFEEEFILADEVFDYFL